MESCSCNTKRAWFILYSFAAPFKSRIRVFRCDVCKEQIEREVQVHIGSFLPRPELSQVPKKVMWATELLFPSGNMTIVEHGR